MSSDERRRLEDGLTALGAQATAVQLSALLQYLDILEETNRSFNLTRIPRQEYVTLHLLDSLTCLHNIADSQSPSTILDVGTGAGFPGIPIAALRPSAQVTVLDATAKKVRFVTQTAQQVGITNVAGIHGRSEALARTPAHRETFDVVVSRAVAPFPKLVELMLPLVKLGGVMVAMKGQGFEVEVAASGNLVENLGGSEIKVEEVALPGTDITRFTLVIRKVAPTPALFPRKNL